MSESVDPLWFVALVVLLLIGGVLMAAAARKGRG